MISPTIAWSSFMGSETASRYILPLRLDGSFSWSWLVRWLILLVLASYSRIESGVISTSVPLGDGVLVRRLEVGPGD